MPTQRRATPAVKFHVFSFSFCGQLGGFPRIDAKIDDVEIAADVEPQFLHRFDQAVVNECAQHRAMEVTEDKQRRFGSGIRAKLKTSAIRIAKNEVARNLLADFLLERDLI